MPYTIKPIVVVPAVSNSRQYLSNISWHKRPLYEEAIGIYGKGDIHIDDEPMPVEVMGENYSIARPNMIGSFFSVYKDAGTVNSASEFWNIVRNLHNELRWKTYFSLIGMG